MKLASLSLVILLSCSGRGNAQCNRAATPAAHSSHPTVVSDSAANPEMKRLAKALIGDWDTVETMERNELFPNGGSRHGKVHVKLAAGGTVLIYEVHSNGSAGRLDGFHTIWWDSSAKQYYFFACFNSRNHPCRMRGTAHWERDTFVNDYGETFKSKKSQWRDSFTFTPTTHTLVAAMIDGSSTPRTVITTTATRSANSPLGNRK